MSGSPERSGEEWTLVDRSVRKRRRESSDDQGLTLTEVGGVHEVEQDAVEEIGEGQTQSEALPESNASHGLHGDHHQELEQVPAVSIPSYEEATSSLESLHNQEDMDMLLALQLSMAESDGEEIDVANFVSTEERESWTTALNHNLEFVASETLGDEHDDVMRALLPSRTAEQNTNTPPRPTPLRDRYDVAGIPTYRVDPRGANSIYSRYRRSATQIPEVTTRNSSRPSHRVDDSKASPLDARSILEALKKRHPVLDPSSGAPLVNILGPDTFRYLMDFLYFPDAFALALTCKAVCAAVDLKAKKIEYKDALLSKAQLCGGAQAQTSPSGRALCEACLYELPSSYFKQRTPSYQEEHTSRTESGGSKRTKLDTAEICNDCSEFRDRVEAVEQKKRVSGNFDTGSLWLVWRPNQRVVVDGTGGFLWYRRRA